MSRRVPILLLAAALSACVALLPGGADGATGGSKVKTPVVSSVSPMKAGIGDKLTVKGANFVAGTRANTVVFQRDGARPLFVRADRSSTRRIVLTVPATLLKYLPKSKGQPVFGRFRIRVLARRFGRAFTSRSKSPLLGPAPQTGEPIPSPTVGDCDKDGTKNDADADDDNDLLTDVLEATTKTDPCRADTDGDRVADGYEYESALDFNRRALPYAGKRPYANPLFADAGDDHDGDGLMLWQEYLLWAKFGDHKLPLNYSAGTQHSGGTVRTDDDKDADGDGLGNWVETQQGPLGSADWWKARYTDERAYEPTFHGTSFIDGDSDGDGILDGADDIDEDGYSNARESIRADLWVQPFNPCLPDWHSRTCSLHPPITNPWPPFSRKDLLGTGGPIGWPLPDKPAE